MPSQSTKTTITKPKWSVDIWGFDIVHTAGKSTDLRHKPQLHHRAAPALMFINAGSGGISSTFDCEGSELPFE